MVGLKVKRKDGGKMVKERLRARTAEKLRLRSSSSKHEAWSTEQQFASLLRSKFEFEERSTKQFLRHEQSNEANCCFVLRALNSNFKLSNFEPTKASSRFGGCASSIQPWSKFPSSYFRKYMGVERQGSSRMARRARGSGSWTLCPRPRGYDIFKEPWETQLSTPNADGRRRRRGARKRAPRKGENEHDVSTSRPITRLSPSPAEQNSCISVLKPRYRQDNKVTSQAE